MATEATAVVVNPQAIELPRKLVTSGESLAKRALSLRVTDPESYELAATVGRQLKDEKAARVEFFRPIKRSIDASKQVVLDREKAAIAPLDEAMRHLDTAATTWRSEQQRKELAARQQAEEKERKRIEAERKQQAKEALADGDKKLAKQIQSAPIIPQVTIESAIPQVAGLRRRTVWKFRVTNPAAVPREWCIPDEKAIGEFVREHKEAAKDKIPGVEAYAEEHTI